MKPEIELTIREAKREDLKLFFRWCNDPLTRAMSLNSEPIPLETHKNWYEQALKDPKLWIWVIESEGAPVGSIRFKAQADFDFLMSIQIDPSFRKKGLGQKALELALVRFKELNSRGKLLAQIKRKNSASHKIFLSLGFEKVGSEGSLDNYELIL